MSNCGKNIRVLVLRVNCYTSPMKRPASTSWGNVAGWYDELLSGEGTYQSEVILPNLLRRLGDVKGRKILDLACGQGFFSYEFCCRGAHVTGVDISAELIKIAKKRISPKMNAHLEFVTAPADKIPFVPDHSIDRVTIILALQNIENVKGVLSECSRVLKADGTLHLVLNHPAFRVPKASDWGWDDANKTQYRRIDRYLSETKVPIQMHPGDRPEEMTISFHRPLQTFFKQFEKSGFCVAGLEEWISHKRSDSGPRAKAENRARAEIPLFLYLGLQRHR